MGLHSRDTIARVMKHTFVAASLPERGAQRAHGGHVEDDMKE